ncbi:phosphatidate cytidylyltransferase [Cryomorpha ignava]|uniref:phosphatidate cytidylyltransferase n=1 Tax=Cryomorpha ignava TaxID=101383 RepID=UPI001952A33C|nr:phosphatidate cytidylyltransferase [Cryomorpha ignava]
MRELFLRISTGLVFLIVVISSIVYNPYTLASLFYVVGVLGMLEYYSLAKIGGTHPQSTLGVITGTVLYIAIELVKLNVVPIQYVGLSIPFFIAIFIYELYRQRPDPFNNIAHTIIGIIYVMAPLALLNVFSFEEIIHEYQPEIVLGFFVMLWLNDTGAYAFGRLFGRHKLFPRISPNKTWEGLIGGMLAAIGGGWIISIYYQQFTVQNWLILAILITISASFGDLVESMLKRSLKVKDSSNLLPGHGGILDRFDGVLLASPIVFTYLMIFVH